MDQADTTSGNYQAAGVLGGNAQQPQDSMSALEAQAAQTGGTVVLERIDEDELAERRQKEIEADASGADVEDSAGDNFDMDVQQVPVPSAVFGNLDSAGNDAGNDGSAMGALSRFKAKK